MKKNWIEIEDEFVRKKVFAWNLTATHHIDSQGFLISSRFLRPLVLKSNSTTFRHKKHCVNRVFYRGWPQDTFTWVGFVKDATTKHVNCHGSLAFFKNIRTFISTLKEKGPQEKMIFLIYSSQHFSYQLKKPHGQWNETLKANLMMVSLKHFDTAASNSSSGGDMHHSLPPQS